MTTAHLFKIENRLHMEVDCTMCVLGADGRRLSSPPRSTAAQGMKNVLQFRLKPADATAVTLQYDGRIMLAPADFVGDDGNLLPSVAANDNLKRQLIVPDGGSPTRSRHSKVHEHFRELERKWKDQGNAAVLWQNKNLFKLIDELIDDLIDIRARNPSGFDAWAWGEKNKPVILGLYYLAALYVLPYPSTGTPRDDRWRKFAQIVPSPYFEKIGAWVGKIDSAKLGTHQVAQYLEEFIEKHLPAYEQTQP